MLRALWLVAFVACDSGKPATPAPPVAPPPPPLDAFVADAIEIDAMSSHDLMVQAMKPLKDLQAKLGDKASTCDGVATILAFQRSRPALEPRIASLCKADRWNVDMRQCVANADHDPLSCSFNLKGKANARFDELLLATP